MIDRQIQNKTKRKKERLIMKFDIKLSISFLVCTVAVGISALLLTAPIDGSKDQPQEISVLRVRT